MSKFKNPSKYNSKSSKMTVPITVNGAAATLDTATIPKGDWISCHGKTKSGVEVNSLKIAFSGDSAIIEREDGFRTSFNANELEVLSEKYSALRAVAMANLAQA